MKSELTCFNCKGYGGFHDLKSASWIVCGFCKETSEAKKESYYQCVAFERLIDQMATVFIENPALVAKAKAHLGVMNVEDA